MQDGFQDEEAKFELSASFNHHIYHDVFSVETFDPILMLCNQKFLLELTSCNPRMFSFQQ